VELCVEGESAAGGELFFSEFVVDAAGLGDYGRTIEIGDLDVAGAVADFSAWFEYGELHVALGVFKKIRAVVGFVGAGDYEVQVAIFIVVHGQGPSPQTYAEIDR